MANPMLKLADVGSIAAAPQLSVEEAAQSFAAAGSEPRLEVVLLLVRAGSKGLTTGEIQTRLGIPASTLAHHLRFLAAAGLIEQAKRGRFVINRADFERLNALAAYLLRECCIDTGERCD